MEAVQELRTIIEDYTPSDEVLADLNYVTLVPIIGPTAVGKNTLINTVADNHTEFSRAVSFTTRDKRTGETNDDYLFLPHDEATIQQIINEAKGGRYVQIVVHPTTGYVYGTSADAYSTEFVMLDAVTTALPSLHKLPFKNIVNVALTCEPKEWQVRFDARESTSSDDDKKRIQEGIDNLNWCLDRKDNLLWLDGTRRNVADTADKLVSLVKDGASPDQKARKTGEQLLYFLNDYRVI